MARIHNLNEKKQTTQNSLKHNILNQESKTQVDKAWHAYNNLEWRNGRCFCCCCCCCYWHVVISVFFSLLVWFGLVRFTRPYRMKLKWMRVSWAPSKRNAVNVVNVCECTESEIENCIEQQSKMPCSGAFHTSRMKRSSQFFYFFCLLFVKENDHRCLFRWKSSRFLTEWLLL